MRNPKLLFILLFLFSLTFVLATTYTVCETGCDYKTINQALLVAKDGDNIKVLEGVYNENIIISKNVFLNGENAEIRGTSPVVLINSSDVSFTGFIVTPTDEASIGIKMNNSDIYSTNNNVVNGSVTYQMRDAPKQSLITGSAINYEDTPINWFWLAISFVIIAILIIILIKKRRS